MILFRILVTLLCLITNIQAASASGQKDISSFATIPILHEGRIKPMDSFARSLLKTLCGKESLHDIDAIEWVEETISDPVNAANRPIIKIRNPDLLGMLTLGKKPLYSFSELLPKVLNQRDLIATISQKPESDWTQSQHDLMELQKKLAIIEQLMDSISSMLPLNVEIPDDAPAYLKPYIGKTITYRDTLKFREQLDSHLRKIVSAKGDNLPEYNHLEQTLAFISFTVDQLRQKGEHNILFKVLPSDNGIKWSAPWEILSIQGSPDTAELIPLWQDLVMADTPESWNKTIIQLNERTQNLGHVSKVKIDIEYAYNLLHPHETSLVFYILTLCLACAGLLLNKNKLLEFSGYSLGLGVFIHILGIIARIYILSRPPVSTLYETILFVGAITVTYGLVLWFRKKENIFLLGAALGGVLLHTLSFAHSNDGDSMVMLDAVLNTNFWLATHVLCITTGYAFCLVASAFAHYLLMAKAPPYHIQSSLLTSTLLALFFATLGTILGGIWADQSWGGFWGWDPKENGALLITLWLIWIIHGRISGQMRQSAFQASVAYLSVIVALSWFGVNLLGVGLHSYGFTDSLALWLGLFVVGETIIIGTLWWRKHHAA